MGVGVGVGGGGGDVVVDGGRGRVDDVVVVVGERFDVRRHGCVLLDVMKSLYSVYGMVGILSIFC